LEAKSWTKRQESDEQFGLHGQSPEYSDIQLFYPGEEQEAEGEDVVNV
jgi:hypothetical protein